MLRFRNKKVLLTRHNLPLSELPPLLQGEGRGEDGVKREGTRSGGSSLTGRFFLAILAAAALLSLPAAALAAPDLPVDGGVTSGVGWRVDPFGSGRMVFHRGIDIAVPVGTPVKATRKGRVAFAGERRGYGATVIVEHADGGRTMYGHNSLLRVRSGEEVDAGTVVAFSGNTGRSTGPHVHYEEIPGSGGARPDVAAAEPVRQEVARASAERLLLEQKMEQSLNAVLETIRSGISGAGG